MSDKTQSVECGEHGQSYATFVCQHLAFGSNQGFFCATDPEDPRPDAWYAECDTRMMADGGWNDESQAFAQITLICSNCYDEAKRKQDYG